jgi:hypothetical protein
MQSTCRYSERLVGILPFITPNHTGSQSSQCWQALDEAGAAPGQLPVYPTIRSDVATNFPERRIWTATSRSPTWRRCGHVIAGAKGVFPTRIRRGTSD